MQSDPGLHPLPEPGDIVPLGWGTEGMVYGIESEGTDRRTYLVAPIVDCTTEGC